MQTTLVEKNRLPVLDLINIIVHDYAAYACHSVVLKINKQPAWSGVILSTITTKEQLNINISANNKQEDEI